MIIYLVTVDCRIVDVALKSELEDMVESLKNNYNETLDYLGDLVAINMLNKGNSAEYVQFKLYFPSHVEILALNSEVIGRRTRISQNPSTNTKLQHLASLTGDDLAEMNELQAVYKKLILRSGRELNISCNYDADSFARTLTQKFTNQFLVSLNFYSTNPEDLNVKISSANFGHGAYPRVSKHRWLLRTISGYNLKITFNFVDIENGFEQIGVYSVKESMNETVKRLITEVTNATTVSADTNVVLIRFSTTEGSRHHRGFNATINVYDVKTKACGTPEQTENGYYMISDGDVVAKEGVNVTYHCNENYTMADHSIVTLECFDGEFQPSFADAQIYCKQDPIWSEWEKGVCSKACLGGSRTDKRVCIHGNCEGASEITVNCNDRTCKEAAVTCGSGVQNKSIIADSQLSASSEHQHGVIAAHRARHARLFGLSGVAAWMTEYNDKNQWIQTDFLDQVEITGVATQGRGDGEEHKGHSSWVTQYTVSYKSDENGVFKFVTDENGATIIFPGNSDRETVVANQFPSKIKARYFRINPTAWHQNINMRFDFLTC